MSTTARAAEHPTDELRRFPLPKGQVLLIRHVEAGDVDDLAALYARLDEESRYRRFFSIHRPGRSFFERMVAVGERGGAGVVALIEDEDEGEGEVGGRLVGETGYELLPNGNGELAITVDRAWRGWLGPYLLDTLVEVAASRGVPNLEADVLATNRPMLAVLGSRGYAAVPNRDWTIVRAVIGTATRTPAWSVAHTGLRVLVEGAGGQWHAADAATAAGFEVLACPGPVGRGSRCPALAGEPCPLAAGADVIVVSHPRDIDPWSTLRAAHPRLHPQVPVCVELAVEGGGASGGETVISGPQPDLLAVLRRLGQTRGSDALAVQERPRP